MIRAVAHRKDWTTLLLGSEKKRQDFKEDMPTFEIGKVIGFFFLPGKEGKDAKSRWW